MVVLFWTSAGASPIGYPPTNEQTLRDDDSSLRSSFQFSPKNWLDVDIWIKVDPDDNFSENLFDSSKTKKAPAAQVTAYLFSYGAYLNEWELPFFETGRQQGFVAERPFEYKGPFPVPGYASGPVSGKFEYPYAQMLPKMKQGAPQDAFSQKYAPPAEEVRFEYPHAQLAPKGTAGPAVPASSGPRWSSGASSQGGGSQGTGAQSYQYGTPTPGSGYPGQSPIGQEQRMMEEKFRGDQSEIGQFRQEVAVSRAVGKPYGMILLGAGLTAVAALFRMFRLSLVIMVGWLIFYGRDVWRIIVDLV